MGRPFFPLFFKDREKLQYLSMEQRGELLTALFAYAEDGEIPAMDGLLGFAFEVFREGIDVSLQKYEETCRKNQENGKKGGRPKKNPTASEKTERFSRKTQNNPTKPSVTQKTETEDRSRRQKQKIEDEVEAEAEAETVPAVLTAAITNDFYDLFGRNPSAEFLKTVNQLEFTSDVVATALRKSKNANAKSPEGYATQILRSWLCNGMPIKYQSTVDRAIDPNAPLADWEKEWMEEFQAAQKQMEDNT